MSYQAARLLDCLSISQMVGRDSQDGHEQDSSCVVKCHKNGPDSRYFVYHVVISFGVYVGWYMYFSCNIIERSQQLKSGRRSHLSKPAEKHWSVQSSIAFSGQYGLRQRRAFTPVLFS